MTIRAWPGQPYPLGATWDGQGVNFALFSQHATAAELCLFHKEDHRTQIACIPMPERTDQIFHCYLPDARPGLSTTGRAGGISAPALGVPESLACSRDILSTFCRMAGSSSAPPREAWSQPASEPRMPSAANSIVPRMPLPLHIVYPRRPPFKAPSVKQNRRRGHERLTSGNEAEQETAQG